MGHKSWVVHYKNKYPGCQVLATESSLDVYDADGNHRVAMRRDGAGNMVCRSEEFGASDKHCLAPIPKDSRRYKVQDGKIALDEAHEERAESSKQYLKDGKVQSCHEIGAGKFDEKHRLLK